jgi:hypothetical protein
MPHSPSSFWRCVFWTKGIYNYLASVSMFFLDDWLRAMWDVPPGDPVYRTMFLALCFSFGMGYSTVSRDLTKNHAVIRMGILGQLAVFGVTTWAVFLSSTPLPKIYLGPALIDLAYALAFIKFLLQYPKTAWTAW